MCVSALLAFGSIPNLFLPLTGTPLSVTGAARQESIASSRPRTAAVELMGEIAARCFNLEIWQATPVGGTPLSFALKLITRVELLRYVF
jgi:hypothetical protein